ncbi:MAG: glycosyltransferase involved in cell wall biosynthesis [Paraglaciecola sp.]|jgi:glycosyltransferase involved in cell wall biosynthesis
MTVFYTIVMFAHNEEKNIGRSIKSVLDSADGYLNKLYVIANGCTDNTCSEVQKIQLTRSNDQLALVELQLGDKCNAWNQYVHHIADESPIHFFVDADVQFVVGSFGRLSQHLANDAEANAAAGLPFSGRNQQQYLDMVKQGRCLFGNCYALKLEFIEKIRRKSFYLPIGLGWIDSAITKIVNRDLQDIPNPKEGRIVYDLESGYRFDSLSLFSKADRQLYINRIVRYRLGKYQEKYLEKGSFLTWPRILDEINSAILNDIQCNAKWFNILDRYFVAKRIVKQNQKLAKVVSQQ